jgi:hypothetical protein
VRQGGKFVHPASMPGVACRSIQGETLPRSSHVA